MLDDYAAFLYTEVTSTGIVNVYIFEKGKDLNHENNRQISSDI